MYPSWGVRGIFFRGGNVIFPDFFSWQKIPILVDPKQISVESEKQAKKKKKKPLFPVGKQKFPDQEYLRGSLSPPLPPTPPPHYATVSKHFEDCHCRLGVP